MFFCASLNKIRSSSNVQTTLVMLGSMTLCHLSRSCFGYLTIFICILNSLVISIHDLSFGYFSLSLISNSSSIYVHACFRNGHFSNPYHLVRMKSMSMESILEAISKHPFDSISRKLIPKCSISLLSVHISRYLSLSCHLDLRFTFVIL